MYLSWKHGHKKESDKARFGKETPAKAPITYGKPRRFTGASEPGDPARRNDPPMTHLSPR